jgi:hypothetical protein
MSGNRLPTKELTITSNNQENVMYAIEFETDVHNNTIQIPCEHKGLEAKRIRVFIVEVSNSPTKLPAGFLNPVSITSYKDIAKRDDLYDR